MRCRWWVVVLAGCVGCAGAAQVQRAETHASARAQAHERSSATKQPPKNGDGTDFASVLPVVID